MTRWIAGVGLAIAILVIAGAIAVSLPEWAPILVGFLLGVLGAGAGAVLQQIIGDDRRRRVMLRALAQEVEENIARAGPPEDRGISPGRMSRSAWEAARGLDLEVNVFTALRAAYTLGEDLNARIGIVDAFAATPIVGESGANAAQVRSKYHNELQDAAEEAANETREAFEAARDVLKPLV